MISGLLGFWQEHSATNAVEKLLAIVQIKAAVLRDGKEQEIFVEDIVAGDIVILNAGDIVPGDCLLLESKDIFVDEAMLTGETFPVEKATAVLAADTPLAQRTNSLWMIGTHIVSGSAKALVSLTGKETEFGKVSERLKLKPQETEFEHGIRRFGYFLGSYFNTGGDHFCHKCVPGASCSGFIFILISTCCWTNPAAIAGYNKHQPCPWCKKNGSEESHC